MDTKVKNAPQLSKSLMWCLAITFTVITFAKINYSASVAFVVSKGMFSKTEAGIINSTYFLIYALFQIFAGKLLDRMSPYFAVSFSIVGGIAVNIVLAFTTDFAFVMILWTLNGFFQFSVWPGIISLTSGGLHDEHKKTGVSLVTLAIAAGSMLSYAVAPIILEAFSWSGLFIFNGAILAISLAYWLILQNKTDGVIYTSQKNASIEFVPERGSPSETAISVYFRSGLVFVFMVVLFGGIGAGIKSWIPTMMLENYNVSTIRSGMQTAIIYICNMFGIIAVMNYGKYISNETGTLGLLYGATLPFAFILISIGRISQLFAIICFVFISTLTYVSTNITAMMSVRLSEKGYGHSGSLAGIINGFSSLSVVIASALFGYVAERFDWKTVIFCCIVCLSVSVFLIIPAYFMWKRFIGK